MKTKLSELCQGYSKNIAIKDLTNNNGVYPIYGAAGYIKNVDFYILDRDYIGIVKDGAGVGRVDKYPAYSSLLGTMQYIVPNVDIDINYLKYLLVSLHLENGVSGAAIPHIYFKNYKNSIVNVCDKQEQIEIANYLDLICNGISLAKKRLSSLDELVKSRFIEMFIGKGFEQCKIKYLVDRKITSSKKGHLPTDLIKYIDISSIDNQKNEVVSYTEYKLLDAPSRAQQCLIENDILVSTVRPNLKNIAINRYNDSNVVGSSGFCVLRSTLCNPLYLLHCILTDDFTTQMTTLTSGASYPAIRDNDVIDYEVINPPIELQNEFAEFVKLIDKSKFIVQQQIKDLQELLDSKMDEYFK